MSQNQSKYRLLNWQEDCYPDKVNKAAQCPIMGSIMSRPPLTFDIVLSFDSMNSVVFKTLVEPAPPNTQILPSGKRTEAAYALGVIKLTSDCIQLLVR